MSLRRQRSRGFTLLEIMIVVAIVTILSWLALVVIKRVRDRAVQSMLQNNLRQIYQAKEYYFAETGEAGPISASKLSATGYLSRFHYDRIFVHGSLETKAGWHYSSWPLNANEPVMAYRGLKPLPTDPVTENVIYYPGPPASAPLPGSGSPGNQPPVVKPPDTYRPVVTPPDIQPPVVTTPDTGSQPDPGKPPTSGNPTNPNPNQPVLPPSNNPSTTSQPHGPGNSDFGHSHNPGHGNSHKQN